MPFFKPAYNTENSFELWAGHLPEGHMIRDVLAQMMAPPLFPVPPDIFKAEMTFHDFRAGETIDPYADVRIRTAPLNHPNSATGYRFEHRGLSLCYVTDTEHAPGKPDQNILALIEGADLAILNTADNAPGAADWRDGMKLCDRANAKTYVLFHHHPANDDAAMDRIASEADALRPGTVVAREGMVLDP